MAEPSVAHNGHEHPLPDAHAQRVREVANAAQVARAIVATWHEIDMALTPIIGQRGVAALYKRSLYTTSGAHPCLAGMHERVQTVMDLAALESVLAQQSSAEAAAGGNALLLAFHVLLAALVGPSLTEQLLHPAWTPPSSGQSEKDTSP